MATKNKTTETVIDVRDFIEAFVDNDQKKADSFKLIELMSAWSGCAPKMWGPSIIGFGRYHYKYASGHEGEAPIIAFSPRKAEFSLYVHFPTEDNQNLLADLGKFKMGKACIYVKKLADINLTALETICKATIKYAESHYEVKTGSEG
jgi:hypothetical protein